VYLKYIQDIFPLQQTQYMYVKNIQDFFSLEVHCDGLKNEAEYSRQLK